MSYTRRLIVDAEFRYRGEPQHVRRLEVSVPQPPVHERPIVVLLYARYARVPLAELHLTRKNTWELAELLDEAGTSRRFEG